MADRKSSDNPLLTSVASGDLIDILDVSETTDSQKNKSITYNDFLTQLSSDLSLGGSPTLTEQTTSWQTGFSGTLSFYKLGRVVAAQFDITVASPASSLAMNAGVINSSGYPINTQHNIVASLNQTTNVRIVFNATGQLDVYQNGSSATAPNGRYLVCWSYFSLL